MRLFELDRSGGVLGRILRRQRAREAVRTGLHVSTICDDWVKTLDAKRYEREINATSVLAFQEVGNTLEDVLAKALSARVRGWTKPRPRQDRRGVWGSPDGVIARQHTIDEIKATWITEGVQAADSKTGKAQSPFVVIGRRGRIQEESLKFTRYRMQATHYAYMWGADRIRFHVLFICGNYRPPFPNPRTFILRLTEKDKQHNAELIWQHAEDRGWLKPGKRAPAEWIMPKKEAA